MAELRLDGRRRTIAIVALALLLFGEILGALGLCAAPHAQLLPFVRRGDPFTAGGLAGAFLIFVGAAEQRRIALRALGVGLVLEGLLAAIRLTSGAPLALVGVSFGGGLGVVAIGFAVHAWARSAREERTDRLRELVDVLILPIVVVLSATYLELTILLHPRTWDLYVYRADASLGFQPSFAVGRLFHRLPALKWFSATVYGALPVALAAVQALHRRRERALGVRGDNNAVVSFLLVGAFGYLAYHIFPVVGPFVVFNGPFPMAPPSVGDVPGVSVPVVPLPRNCMPSLHTAWALVLFFRSRALRPTHRVIAFGWLFFTVLSTLGLGFHYAWDLVAAVPFAVGTDLASEKLVDPTARQRRKVVVAGCMSLVLALFAALRFAGDALLDVPALGWILVLLTLAASVIARRRAVELMDGSVSSVDEPAEEQGRGGVRAATAFALMFSGFAALVYEVVSAKVLALTFGSTSVASTTVLVTYMAGLGLGAAVGGRLMARMREPLRVYLLCEAGIATWCVLSLPLLRIVQRVYVVAATGTPPGHPSQIVLQLVLGSLVVLPPTMLMGATMPAVARFLEQRSADLGDSVRVLYGANTLGAAAGAMLTGYVLLPGLGVRMTLAVGMLANLLACGVAALLRRTVGRESAPTDGARTGASGRWEPIALLALFIGGAVSLALEVVYTHLLGVVAGNSAYALSLMLTVFLAGLAFGAAAARRVLVSDRGGRMAALGVLQIGLAICVAGGVFLWDAMPGYFASYAGYAAATSFAQREFVRAVVCCLAMLPSAACIGASYAVAMAIVVDAAPTGGVARLGLASAINTMGNIGGALLANFALVPVLGSLRALQTLTVTSLLVGCVPFVARAAKPNRALVGVLAAAAVVLALQPRAFDLTKLASGANVYFQAQGYGEVIDHAESIDGGLTTVAESKGMQGERVLTLVTNGKFQGDDSASRELVAQYAFSIAPLLHTDARGSALVIGYGTGTSARCVKEAGFGRLDIVELSKDVISVADRYFASVNGGVSRQPGSRVYVTDGRNYLLLQNDAYDFIGIEVSAIWFAGASSLYSRDFYELVKKRLRPGGVLQQWVQLHHIQPRDVATILGTVRRSFRQVWLYVVSRQGVIVACDQDCPPSATSMAMLSSSKSLNDALGGGPWLKAIGNSLILAPADLDRFLDRSSGGDLEALESNDDNLTLEYSTPQGNVLPYADSLQKNLAVLRSFRGPR